MVSSVSPGATVIAVPPSQVKRGGGGAGGGREPVTSPLPGSYEPMPRPPPETPSPPLRRGSAWLSTRLPDCGTEPVTSPPKGRSKSEKRLESVQPAAPKPINATATTCGQTAERRDAHMITRPHATI